MTVSAQCPEPQDVPVRRDLIAHTTFGHLPYTPTDQQLEVIASLALFCSGEVPDDTVYVLNGYAGTGKTSLMGALVRTLTGLRVPVVLMAPTGRAAKVFGNFARHFATTIHRRIYRMSMPGQSGEHVTLAENNLQGAVFIVDEASMIGGESNADGRPGLLDDLIYYVYSGINCRMILVGDTAQLPPVGCTDSPAMDKDKLRAFGLKVMYATMTATVRQAHDSGVLYNATWLRRAMRHDPLPIPAIHLRGVSNVYVVEGTDLIDTLESAYAEAGIDNTLVVTRSNKTAVGYNLGIRSRILDREEELCYGERLLVAKNNYFWSAKIKGLDFIANGDVGIVERIIATEEKYGMRFADVLLTLTDRTEPLTVECKIFLDTLTAETPSLGRDAIDRLGAAICSDNGLYGPEVSMAARWRLLKLDPYFNALQVKYAYALTCHKSQGGQWAKVFVDMGYIPPEAQGLDFYRWLYTATTRSTQDIYYINPHIPVK